MYMVFYIFACILWTMFVRDSFISCKKLLTFSAILTLGYISKGDTLLWSLPHKQLKLVPAINSKTAPATRQEDPLTPGPFPSLVALNLKFHESKGAKQQRKWPKTAQHRRLLASFSCYTAHWALRYTSAFKEEVLSFYSKILNVFLSRWS